TLFEKGIVQSPDMTEARIKMARIPEGGVPLDNRVGGAPGVKLEAGNSTIFSLPGVPAELQFIFKDSVVPWISKRVTQKFYEQVVEFGMHDESTFAPAIDVVMNKHPDVYVKSMPKTYGTSKSLRVWISGRGENLEEITEKVKKALQSLEETTGLPSKSVEV
ncbi:MAG: competence/damage-inducible protein A, partial [Candidatus Thorarchaeota archaeon]